MGNATPERLRGDVDALAEKVVRLGDSLRGRIARGEDRVDALEKEGAELARHVRRLDGSAHARLSALETTAAGKAETEQAIEELGRKATATHDFACTISSHLGKAEHRIAALETDLRGARETLADLRRWAGLDGAGHRFPSFVRYTPDADMRTAGLTPERVYAVLGRDTRYIRLEGDDGKPVDIAPRFLVAVPGPADAKPDTSSPELAERRGAGPHRDTRVRGALVRCSRLGCAVVLPTNIERKDGTYAALCEQHLVGPTIYAVIRRAPDLPPDPKAEAAATLSRACERIRDFWEKDAGKDGLLVSLVEGLIMATADAKRAGVIP